jgi:hypothetical protein
MLTDVTCRYTNVKCYVRLISYCNLAKIFRVGVCVMNCSNKKIQVLALKGASVVSSHLLSSHNHHTGTLYG